MPLPHHKALRQRTEAKLNAALQRLIDGQPMHPSLQGRSYTLSVTNLSLEANVSRNSIHTRHPSFRDKLKEARAKQESTHPPPRTPREKINELQAIIDGLRSDVCNRVTQNASLLLRATQAETALNAKKCRNQALQLTQGSD